MLIKKQLSAFTICFWSHDNHHAIMFLISGLSVTQADEMFQLFPLSRTVCMLVTSNPPIRPCFLQLCICIRAHLQARAIWHKQLSDSIIQELPCPDQHWAHTGPDKRHPWQLVGHVFSRPHWNTEFCICQRARGVGLCTWEEKRDNVDLCVCFGVTLCVMNGNLGRLKMRRV